MEDNGTAIRVCDGGEKMIKKKDENRAMIPQITVPWYLLEEVTKYANRKGIKKTAAARELLTIGMEKVNFELMQKSQKAPLLLWLDVETTGLYADKNAVIEFGIITDRAGQIIDRHKLRVAPFPNDIIDDDALKVNLRTREEIAAYPDPLEVAEKLMHIFAHNHNAGEKYFLAGWCPGFDKGFLDAFFRKCGYTVPDIFDRHTVDVFSKYFDAYQLEEYKLDHFVKKYLPEEYDEKKLHSALYDIDMARKLYYLKQGV